MTPLLVTLASCERVEEISGPRNEVSTEVRGVLNPPSYEGVMKPIEHELRSYQLKLIKGGGDFFSGDTVDPHTALALGDIKLENQNLTETLALEQLNIYFRSKNNLSDMSKHTGDAINVLIRTTNMDWNREFNVTLDDDKQHEKGTEPLVRLTLREITKSFLRHLPQSSVHGLQKWREPRPDEWILLLLAYASEDEDLKQFIDEEMLAYSEEYRSKPKKAHVGEYIEGTQAEVNESEVDDSQATCLGTHALEALLVYYTFGNDEENAQFYLEKTIDSLNEINNQKGELTLDEFFKLSHLMDALGQIASRTNFSEEQTDIIRESFERGAGFLQSSRKSSESLGDHNIGMLSHFYIGAKNLKAAAVL